MTQTQQVRQPASTQPASSGSGYSGGNTGAAQGTTSGSTQGTSGFGFNRDNYDYSQDLQFAAFPGTYGISGDNPPQDQGNGSAPGGAASGGGGSRGTGQQGTASNATGNGGGSSRGVQQGTGQANGGTQQGTASNATGNGGGSSRGAQQGTGQANGGTQQGTASNATGNGGGTSRGVQQGTGQPGSTTQGSNGQPVMGYTYGGNRGTGNTGSLQSGSTAQGNSGQPVVGSNGNRSGQPVVGDGERPNAGNNGNNGSNGTSGNNGNNGRQPVVGNNGMQNLVNMIAKGVAKFENGNILFGAAAMLGTQALNLLNISQRGPTCGLSSLAKQQVLRQAMARMLQGGKEAAMNFLRGAQNLYRNLERFWLNNGRHVGNGGTTWSQQISNMRKAGIYDGHARATFDQMFNRLMVSTGQWNGSAGNIYSALGLSRGGGGGIDHAMPLAGSAITRSGDRALICPDTSGILGGRNQGYYLLTRNAFNRGTLGAGRADFTWTDPFVA